MAKTVLVAQDSERMLSLLGHSLDICGIWLSSAVMSHDVCAQGGIAVTLCGAEL